MWAKASGVISGQLLRITTISSNTAWIKQADVGYIVVELVAGGAGATGSNGTGGGGGGYCKRLITNPAASYAITIGGGGDLSNGGDTWFGGLAVAYGGQRPAGGSYSGCDFGVQGTYGTASYSSIGSHAGGSVYGGGMFQSPTASTLPTGWGSGGRATNGGYYAGTQGVAIIHEYGG